MNLVTFPQVPPLTGSRAKWPEGLGMLRDMARMDALQTQAARLYPDSAYLQTEWLRAVGVVRRSTGGWLLEREVKRHA